MSNVKTQSSNQAQNPNISKKESLTLNYLAFIWHLNFDI